MEEKKDTIGSETVGGARRAMPTVSDPAAATGPLGPNQRWSVTRKREVALRLLRGESMEALARELGVEIYRREEWKNAYSERIRSAFRRQADRDSDLMPITIPI